MPRGLPTATLVLIGIATGLLCIGVLGLVVALLLGGLNTLPASGLFDYFSGHRDHVRTAIALQSGVSALGYLGILGFGTAVLLTQAQGAHGRAAATAIWLIRFLILYLVLQWLASPSIAYISGNWLAALPTLLSILPFTLVTVAALICAECYLLRQQDDVFS